MAERSVADLLWVANTRHGPGGHWYARPTVDTGDHDHLRDGEDAIGYLVAHGVRVPDGVPSGEVLAALAAIREATRSLMTPEADWSTPIAGLLDTARYKLDDARSIRSSDAGWRAFVEDLLPPLLDVAAVRERLRLCENPMCRLMFLDASKNRSRRWCDTAGCGNRFRVRRHRHAALRSSVVPRPAGPPSIEAG